MNKKYLEFMQVRNPKKKTKKFHIFNKETSVFIGIIKWSFGWRQYISEIETDVGEVMDFSAGCHREVAEFIEGLMGERKNE